MRGNPRVKSFGPTARVLATSVLDSSLRGSPVASDDLAPPVEIVTDESVERIDRGVAPPPDGWVSRALYVGEAGAELARRRPRADLRTARPELLQPGGQPPGRGARPAPRDLRLLWARRRAQRAGANPNPQRPGPGKLRYIPVDISLPLLRKAIANLRPHVGCRSESCAISRTAGTS